MFQEGHAVGLHSHTRRPMAMTIGAVAATIEGAAERMKHLTGHRPCSAFRPHAGWRSSDDDARPASAGFRMIGWGWLLWDADPFRARTPERLVPRLTARAGPGSIIVLHDGHHVDPAADSSTPSRSSNSWFRGSGVGVWSSARSATMRRRAPRPGAPRRQSLNDGRVRPARRCASPVPARVSTTAARGQDVHG